MSTFKKSYVLEMSYNEAEVLSAADCRIEDPNYPNYQKEFRVLVEENKKYLEPKGYVVIEEEDTYLPSPGLMTAYCIVSLGKKIDEIIASKFADFDYLAGMMLNALTNHLIYKASNQLFKEMKEDQELHLSSRYEPSVNDIPDDRQKIICDKIVDSFHVDISTTEAFMISPTKTLAFFYGLEETACGLGLDRVCSSCDMEDCDKRHYMIEVSQGKEKEIIQGKNGDTILNVLRQHDIFVDAPCGGKKLCGKCQVKVKGHEYVLTEEEKAFLPEGAEEEGTILACFHTVDKDLAIEIKPIVDTVKIETNYAKFNVKEPKYQNIDNYLQVGVGVDIGTTTVSISLIDLVNGKVLGIRKYINPQKAYGADVISRIMYAGEYNDGQLTTLIRDSIEESIIELIEEQNMTIDAIKEITISGNTTMTYLLLGMDPKKLAVSPFIIKDIGIHTCDSKDIFNDIEDIHTTVLPYISAYVGGDIISGLFATHIQDVSGNIVFIDIGTNGEMVLKTKDRLISAATAAGPAFEGANIKCGMGSISGAICEVEYVEGKYKVTTIDGGDAEGICGSAIIDLVALLHKQGHIDDFGFMEEPVMIQGDIGLYPEDVRQIQLAKAAIMAGVDILLEAADLKHSDIDAFYIAGGFGSHLNKENSAYIGLIPQEIVGKVKVVGNTSLAGSVRYLLEKDGRVEIETICDECEYIELSTNANFNDAYVRGMGFGDEI